MSYYNILVTSDGDLEARCLFNTKVKFGMVTLLVRICAIVLEWMSFEYNNRQNTPIDIILVYEVIRH